MFNHTHFHVVEIKTQAILYEYTWLISTSWKVFKFLFKIRHINIVRRNVKEVFDRIKKKYILSAKIFRFYYTIRPKKPKLIIIFSVNILMYLCTHKNDY